MAFFKRQWGLFAVIFLTLFAFLPILHAGFFQVHDNTQVERIYEMGKSLQDGMLPVRWVKDLGYGYGYPIFNFYSPFPYYLGGLLSLSGVDLLFATKITFILGILLSGICMFVFLQEFFGKKSAVVASILYVYFPYHAVNIYVRGDLDEMFAYVFIPLIFLGIYKIFYRVQKNDEIKNSFLWIYLTGISISLMIISHNLTAYMMFLFLGLLMIITILYAKYKWKLGFSYFLSLLIGFALSAFYSLPAILEMKYTNIISQIGGGADFHDHFVCLSQLWNSPWGFGGSINGCLDGMSFRLGKTNIIFLLLSISIIILYWNKKKIIGKRLILITSLIFFIISIFMMTDYSTIIWNLFPNMSFIQYPWRFLNFAGFFLSVIVGYGIFVYSKLVKKNIGIIVSVLIIIVTIIFNLKLFSPKEFTFYNSAYYADSNHIKWTVSKISDEYLPSGFNKPITQEYIPHDSFTVVSGQGEVYNSMEETGKLNASFKMAISSIVRANIAAFPAWKLFINGTESMYKQENDGIYFHLPQGESDIEVKYVQTPIEQLGNTITIIGIFTLVLGIIWRRYRYKD